MSDYWKKRLEEIERAQKASERTAYWQSRLNAMEKSTKKDEEIAPVSPPAETESEKEKWYEGWFQKGALEDDVNAKNIGKTILGTISDVGENLGAGVIGMGEKALDALLYIAPYAAQGQYSPNGGVYPSLEQQTEQQIFNDTLEAAKEANRKFIEKDLYDEEAVSKKIIGAPARWAGIDSEESSVLGEKSDALVQSGGQLLATVGLQAVGVPWFVTTGVTGFGSEVENAFNQGADYEEAGVSAAISAGAEILSEKLSGGIKFGGKALDDVLVKQLSRSISNKTLRTMAKLGLDAVGEGSEEVISQVFSNLGSALYKEESVGELLTNEQAMDEYLESFIGGAVLGGVSGGINTVKSAKQGVDYASGLTKNEQAVVDKLYKDRVAEEEKSGKISEKQKSKIYDEVLSDMDKGYISTDTIEEVLGGDTYKSYKDTIDSEEKLQQEYKELGELKEPTLAQSTRYKELHEQIQGMKDSTTRDELKSKLGEEVFGLVQNDRLAESYNERGRRKQAFTADLTQYESKYHDTIKRAAESGILNDTRRTHEFVDMIAKISADKGVLFDFTNNEKLKNSGFAVDGKQVNGFVTKNGITLNIDSAKSLNSVVGHEITHVLEGTELYDALQKAVIEYARGKSDYKGRVKALSEIYEGVEGADISKELTADLVGDYLFNDTDFINSLSTGNRNVFQKIYDEIKYLAKVATAGSKEARELAKVQRAFENAYRESGKQSEGTKYHISKEFEAEIDKTLSNKLDKSNQVKARDFTPELLVNNGVKDLPMLITQNHVKTTVYSEAEAKKLGLPTGKNINYHGLGKDLLVKAVDNMDDPSAIYRKDADHYLIITELQNKAGEPIMIPVKIDGKGTYNDVYIDENQILSAYGKKNLQSYLENNDFELIYKKRETALNEGVQYSDIGDFSDDNVAQKDADVKYSLSDSNGKQLTKEQQEYFKNSKVRDENGNLKVMYHGTPNGDFTVFRDGTYFTDSKEYADRYQSPSASSISTGKVATNPKTFEVYLDIKKPFDIADAEARDIYINDYIKGGNALGINPYLSDAEYEKINAIDWTEGEDLRDFLIENGYDYDGLVLDEGGTGGYGEEVEYRGKSYVVFSSEQIKSVANDKPTADKDIRYSLSDSERAENDVKVMDGGSVTKYSLSTWTPETQTKVRNNLIKAGYDDARVDKWIKDTNSVAAVIAADKDRLDFVAADNQVMLKNNQEYVKTLDASTLCAKRLVYQGTFDAIQHRMPNTMLSSDDLIDLLNMMKKHKVQTPCGVCYVESRRRHLGKFAQEWLNSYKGEYKPNLDEVTTSDGLEALRHSHPDTYKDFVDAMNKKGSSNPKVVQLRTEYRNEIMSLTPAQIKKIEAIGGLRVQSFSDFETPHLLDMMQAVMDMSAKGLTSQAYTKVPNFAWVFGDTGIKINLSLIAEGDGFDADGNLAFSSVEGMDIDEAMKLRDAYSENVGTIIVGANDKHILACMADDRIDFIIPFHRSGWGKNELDMMGMSSYTDYTYGQKEHDLATGKGLENLYPPDYWDYNLSGKENAERYLNLCARTGREPKFSQFLVNNGDGSYSLQPDGSTDGYWKTLIDFKMYNNEGVGAAQQKVQPNFNMDEAYRVLNEYEGGANTLPVANDVVEEFVAKYNSRDELAPAMSLSPEGEQFAPTRRNEVYGRDIRLEQTPTEESSATEDIAPVTVAENATVDAPNVTEAEQTADLQFFSRENEDDIAPEVETNIGKMPVADYRDMVARQNGFDDYEDMRRQGVRLGDSYDTDIAPVPASMAVKDSNPTLTEKYEPSKAKQPKTTPQEQVRAQILTEEPETSKRKSGLWSVIKDNFIDKGTVFEKLDLQRGSRELQARFKAIGRAESKAQYFMEHGDAATNSLKSIRDTVESSGKTKDFYEYLYHQLNVDRMSLEDRYKDVENKPVIGYDVTADMSRNTAAELEAANPEFKKWAEQVYDYMSELRKMLVDNGVISVDTAKRWEEMYPHYVPIRRKGDDGININVALDTRRTGINAPVKRATGGNRDILPLFDTMAMRTEQTFKAVARNRFGVELKNALGVEAKGEAVGVDEAIDSVETHEELLQEDKNGRNPTFTVFENGEKVTFDINDEMYDTMKPKDRAYAKINNSPLSKGLQAVNNIRRNLITEYNPAFMITNPIKDTQDVLINSQHPAKTYANYPTAIKELLTKKGQYYQEYMSNGGDQNTYFDSTKKTFTKEKRGIGKVIGFPLEKISAANNFIERVPRMAEYIASRKEGRSIDVAMLDAARVTTDFSAGGDLVKLANRNGFTFLNASVQGFVQQVRNIREARWEGFKGWAKLAAKVAVAGLPSILLNHLLWDDDEDYAELSDYVKQNYYIVGKFGDGQFVRIPKGRTLAVIQSAFEQMENFVTGNDEVDFEAFVELVVSNLAPNNPLENNIIAPITQAVKNKAWYGGDLVPTRLQNLPPAEQYDESTDSVSRWLGDTLNISPYKVNYVLDQYSGAVGDMLLPMLTPEAERGNNTLIAPVIDKFTTDSVMNNQNVSDFYDTKEELTVNANAYDATDEDKLMSKYMNSVNSELNKLYKQKREVQNSSLSDAEKYEAAREIQKQIIQLTKESLNTYEDIRYMGDLAVIGDKYYKRNNDGEWQKLTGEQLERQEEVTKGLGVSEEEYWSNKEEYSYAYDYPESYAVAKAVGGYEAYKAYTGELNDIKADKDADGKSISGSRKEKVIDYINGLDADYYTKIILLKNEYPSDDTYNYEIIDYLNSRDDISRSEMETILKKLGFEVDSEGNISW